MKPSKLWLSLVFLVIGSVGLLFHDDIRREIKAWRYREAIHDAQAALEIGDYNQVARLTGVALRLSTGKIGEIRELFSLASEGGSPDSLDLGEALFVHPESVAADRVGILEHCVHRNDSFSFESYLARLNDEERNDPRVVAIRVQIFLNKGNRLEAFSLVDSLEGESAQLPSIQLLRARLLAGERGNPLAWQSCRRIVSDLMLGDDPAVALEAFRSLFLLPDLELKKFLDPNLSSWIKAEREAGTQDHLDVAHWQLLVAPGKEDEVIDNVLMLEKKAPEEVARWMVAHKQEKLILERDLDLDSEESLPFYLARLQLHFDHEQWPEAEMVLENPHRSLSSSLLEGLRSGIAGQKKDELKRISHLQLAIEHAKRAESFTAFFSLFEIGKRLDDRDMQRKACEELVSLPARFLPDGQELLFLEIEFGSEPSFLVSMYQKLAAFKPKDTIILYRRAILNFIVNGEREGPLEDLEFLLSEYPDATSLRCAKALMLPQSSASEALAFLEGEVGDPFVSDGAFERAVYSSLLRRDGQTERAMRLEKLIDWASLPEYLRTYFQLQMAL